MELKLGYQQIGRSCAIGVARSQVPEGAEAAGLTGPSSEQWDEAKAEAGRSFPQVKNNAMGNAGAARPCFASSHCSGRASEARASARFSTWNRAYPDRAARPICW